MLITAPLVKYDSIVPTCKYTTCMYVYTITHFQKYKRATRNKYLTSITRLEMEIFNTYMLKVFKIVSANSVTVIAPVKYTPSVNRSNNIDF